MSTRRWRRRETDPSLDQRLVVEQRAGEAGQRPVGDLFVPRDRDGPAVVLLHGSCGRREDLTQFAVALAQHGIAVLNASWRGPGTNDRFDVGRRDVERALAFARRRFGRPPTLAAWSDGALLGAVSALAPTAAVNTPAAFIGLAGYYGWAGPGVPAATVNERTITFLGGAPEAAPCAWRAANPYCHLESSGRGPPVVLATGELDPQRGHTVRFYDALVTAGHDASMRVLDDCDHHAIVVPRNPPGRAALRLVVEAARASDQC